MVRSILLCCLWTRVTIEHHHVFGILSGCLTGCFYHYPLPFFSILFPFLVLLCYASISLGAPIRYLFSTCTYMPCHAKPCQTIRCSMHTKVLEAQCSTPCCLFCMFTITIGSVTDVNIRPKQTLYIYLYIWMHCMDCTQKTEKRVNECNENEYERNNADVETEWASEMKRNGHRFHARKKG